MKKLLLYFLFFSAASQAQIVNIPDANFKAKLLSSSPSNTIARNAQGMHIAVDANADGEIQLAEAQLVGALFVNNSSIENLEGVQSFTNMTRLSCDVNALLSLDVSGMNNLQQLSASLNPSLATLNITGCSSLTNLTVSSCALTSLDASGLTSLINLTCYSNPLTTLDVSGCSALFDLDAYNCQLTALDFSGLNALKRLNAENNQLTVLNLSGCTNLQELIVRNNQLTQLELSNLGLIQTMLYLDVRYNSLTSFTVNNCNIMYFNAQYNQLTALDLSTCRVDDLDVSYNNLQSFTPPQIGSNSRIMVAHNQLTDVDVSGVTFYQSAILDVSNNNLNTINLGNASGLGQLRLSYNSLQTIDMTGCSATLDLVELSNNPSLETVFAKNGSNNEDFFFGGDDNLIFVCVDEMQLQDTQQRLNIYGLTNAVASPYCFFQPGGNFNTITGNITYDIDNNGCDSTDPDQPYVKLNLTTGGNNYAVFTSPDGTYNNFGLTGTFNISVAMENASLFTITPPLATIVFGDNNNNITTQDFCITANGLQNDLETVIVPIAPARPGFDAIYQIIYKNKGNQVLSGSVDFTYQENELDFVNASTTPDAQTAGSLSWNFSNLYPFESRSIEVRLNVNSPQETPAVNIGDQLGFHAQANPVGGDVTPGDNTFSFKQTVIGSYDPNDITCLEGEHVNPTEIGKYLHYNINFENTGTAAAENIVVVDMIDLTKFDVSTLQVLNASHPMTPRITNGKVEFIFEGINLGASEHGNVTFKIKTKNTLVTGNSVSQKADIYFDYNFPVATNVAMTTFDTLGTDNVVLDDDISIYPNPTKGLVNIKSDSEIKSVELFDVQGRQLLRKNNVETLNISTYTSGVYFIKVATYKGFKTQKLIKQ
ncbi:hypothetical protein HYN48_00470 [Flavobacterium magnum]|uniref:Uncharacterized protein n=1 Tax=Flavobacterium magnum TaxID=2162713 RepID=A0A2S0RBQ9_9FLAO|nr:T9SS type A sorting domain-containing protein [Flavobacterium magnum]AWA28678.1 hypothetical protein HYN48_00470 [Flavobacterium magnum]